MPSLDEMKPFLKDYQRYVEEVLIPTRKEIARLFRLWRTSSPWEQFSRSHLMPIPSPVHSAKVRIKRAESVIDKILRRPDVFPGGLNLNSIQDMSDAIGGKVIVYFLSNLPLLDRVIRSSELLEVSSTQEPIAYMDSDLLARLGLLHLRRVMGTEYASIHYFLRFRDEYLPTQQRPWFELQVLTLTQQTGREMTHLLAYKADQGTKFAVGKQFQIVNRLLVAVEEHFNFVYEELTRFQDEAKTNNSDPINAENLPLVLGELGIRPYQREIDGLIKLLLSRGMSTVGELRETASPRAMALIREAYTRFGGRQPSSFEVVAALPIIRGSTDDSKAIEELKTQIAFLGIWKELKQRA